jgi:hypothetical protein
MQLGLDELCSAPVPLNDTLGAEAEVVNDSDPEYAVDAVGVKVTL